MGKLKMTPFMVLMILILSCSQHIPYSTAGELPTKVTEALLSNRQSLAKVLSEAEMLRSCYRISIVDVFDDNDDKTRPKGQLAYAKPCKRLSDGNGRFRATRYYDGYKGTVVWTGSEDIEKAEYDDPKHPPSLRLSSQRWGSDELDMIDTVLGIYFEYARSVDWAVPRRPSEALADTTVPVVITSLESNGKTLVRIQFDKPFNGKGPKYIYTYDPSRQWIPVRIESRGYTTQEDHENDIPNCTSVKLLQKSKIMEGVWMPLQVYDTTTFIFNDHSEKMKDIYRLVKIDLNPVFTDTDFMLRVNDLPVGSSIADERLSIAYKLGSDEIYMNGHLNEVKQPIDHEIKPDELKNIMKDAIAFIDPVATANKAKLKTVTPTGRYASMTRWGFILLALAFASMGIILWRKNHI